MKKKQNRSRTDRGMPLLLSIIVVFGVIGMVVFSVARKISREMSASAIQNLSESLELMKGTIEAILEKEAEYQLLIAKEISMIDDPAEFVRAYNSNQTMVKMSLILTGETEGVSNSGESFSESELEFSSIGMPEGLQVSRSYINHMGTWAYTMKCPVRKDGTDIAALYIEYIYDSLEKSLPNGFYDGNAMLYIMDAGSERLVLKPRGMGQRDAGHLNLEDFYRANQIVEEKLRDEVDTCIRSGDNILFYHDIRGKSSLNYMWALNGGNLYLIGYVPVDAIQREGRSVNQNILIVVAVMLIAFFICCLLYYLNQRQQNKAAKEREKEREIHNRRLAEALQAAQAANTSKTMFLSNMSHDIRTPMNAVLGFTTLLAMDADNPAKVREYTDKIKASGQHLLGLINDILDMSKIESGKVVLNVEPFTLSDLVSSVDAIIRPMAEAKRQKFHVKIRSIRHESLLGDETRINQVLINLLSNAVKYTPQGSVRLQIAYEQQNDDELLLKISVQDTGIGIREEDMGKLFESFQRLDEEKNRNIEGTGLGMNITIQLLSLLGSRMQVESVYGKGSKFYFDLEQKIIDDTPVGDFRAKVRQAAEDFTYSAKLYAPEAEILVVDDNAVNRKVLRNLLKETQIQVTDAQGGADIVGAVGVGLEGHLALEDGDEGLHLHVKFGAFEGVVPGGLFAL